MATAKPKGLHVVKAKGHVYFYAWRGGPRLVAAPDTPEFWIEFGRLMVERKSGDNGRLGGLVTDYKAASGFLALSAGARRDRTRWLDQITERFGKLHIMQFERSEMRPLILDWRAEMQAESAKNPRADDGARAADEAFKTLSVVLSYGRERGKLMNNVCFGVKRLYANDRADVIWLPEHLAYLERAASPEVFQAAKLASLTGLRKGDLLRLSWPHIKARSVEIETGKSGGQKTTLIPLYGELRTYLNTLPKRNMTVLVNSYGQPWGTGFSASWQTANDRALALIEDPAERAAFDELHFHDLRGTAATRFYAAGLTNEATIAEIMAWSPKAVGALLNKYVRKNALLQRQIDTLDGTSAEQKV